MSSAPTYIEDASAVIGAIGKPEFSDVLAETVKKIVNYDSSLMLGAAQGTGPILLSGLLDEPDKTAFYQSYLSGAYLLAPGYLAGQNSDISGVHSLKDIFPGDMEDSEYFHAYWGKTGMMDEVFIFFRLDQSRVIWFALGRYDLENAFSNEDIDRLIQIEPILRNAVQRHWHGYDFNDVYEDTPDHEYFKTALEQFGAGELSPREYEVCQLLLRGHSSKSAGRLLNISHETERIHRRRIFTKMGVSSHVELMAMFLEGLSTKTDLD